MKAFTTFTSSLLKRLLHHIPSNPLLTKPTPFLHHLFHFILFHPLWLHLLYFISLSFLGFLLLIALPMKDPSTPRPNHFDLFFMSVSANTVSSMTTVELESFSNSQLIVLTLLMLLGGEVFTSMLGLYFQTLKYSKKNNKGSNINDIAPSRELELGITLVKPPNEIINIPKVPLDDQLMKYNSLRYLGFVVLGYLVLAHASGCTLILVYLSLFPKQKSVLELKGIRAHTFAVFTVVSSFTNCGFIPTNENMAVFRTCTGILLTVVVLVLLGNTMYPPFLRLLVWVLKRVTKREEFEFILSRSGELGYDHLMSTGLESVMLGVTVGGFVVVQFILFCCLEWRSDGLDGMSIYQKVVGALFMSVNSRHAGESIVDLSALSPAILVLYVVMMYLPPYTTFLPIENNGSRALKDKDGDGEKRKSLVENLVFSQLSYLAIFVIIIICITEKRHLSDDPLNFNVLNIVFEVISAYGNVGFTTGYSCKRQLKPDGRCKDSWVGFSGRWSSKGKLTLIVVMLFGRLKKFHMMGGKAWKLR